MLIGFLHLHNFLRWVVLILAVASVIYYGIGYFTKKDFSKTDDRLGLFYLIFMDIQLLLGVALFFVGSAFSNLTSDPSFAMKTPAIRFFSVEHGMGMLIAILLVHIGRNKVKSEADDTSKFRKGFIYFGISLLIMLAMIPWPFREGIGRAIFPGM
jgi:Na+/proline symporter